MDPNTVVVLLSFNHISVGALLLLIAHRRSDSAGLHGFGFGAIIFGVACLMRLGMGLGVAAPLGLVSDVSKIIATLCFINGVQRFAGAQPLSMRSCYLAVLAYVAIATAVNAAWSTGGRFAVSNLAVGLGFGALAFQYGARARSQIVALRGPMRLLAVTIAGLAAATAMRGVSMLWMEPETLFAGPWAQAYYLYSTVVTMLMGPILLWMVFVRLNDRLNALATHDPLTQVLNRRGLEEATQRHFSGRPPTPLVLMLLDVDHFKRINDTHGHSTGDLLLQSVAQTLKTQVRGGDVVARWGGEEFLICCQGTDPDWAAGLAERLRQTVATTRYVGPGGILLSCTVSVGVSNAFANLADWDAAERVADTALYSAKHAGRNRVVMGAGSDGSRLVSVAA